MDKPIRVGTRQSQLALTQSNIVVSLMKSMFPELEFELAGIKTKGDVLLDVKLDTIGGKGLFVKEIESALLDGSIDMAVHSMKDMPAYMPERLVIAAVSEREDPRDVLVTSDGTRLEDLKKGSVVGTSSVRREFQLLGMRPDLSIKQLRGNILTRLDKLLNKEYDAIVLAAAGLKRLGLEKECVQYFDVEEMIPAVGQGILGVQVRKGDRLQEMVSKINCPDSELEYEAEREFMLRLNGGCSTPIAAHAILQGDNMRLAGMLASVNCKDGFKAVVEGEKQQARMLGERLADIILRKSGGEVL